MPAWGPLWVNTPVSGQTRYVVGYVYDEASGTLTGYVDGVAVATVSGLGEIDEHTGDIGLGGMNQSSYFYDGSVTGEGLYFGGTIAEAVFYNEVLSPQDQDQVSAYFCQRFGCGSAALPEVDPTVWYSGESLVGSAGSKVSRWSGRPCGR